MNSAQGSGPKKALVTGASRGIGFSIAEKLLEDGFEVIGTSRTSSFPEEMAEHTRFSSLRCDMASLDEVKTVIKPLFSDHGSAPDIVVNNAGIAEDCATLSDEEIWWANWDRTMTVNLHAPCMISKWALEAWSVKEDGILVNIASRAAYRGDTDDYASYAASKGGLVAFTKSIARGFGPKNIAAYSIAPGFIDTDMVREAIPIYGKAHIMKDIMMPELTPPEQVAEIVALLASGKVKHMTGHTFHVNGGSYII